MLKHSTFSMFSNFNAQDERGIIYTLLPTSPMGLSFSWSFSVPFPLALINWLNLKSFLLLTAYLSFPHLVALLSRESFLEKARSEMRNSLPEAHTDILLLLCNLPRKRRENYRPGIEKLLSDACCSIIICCKRD